MNAKPSRVLDFDHTYKHFKRTEKDIAKLCGLVRKSPSSNHITCTRTENFCTEDDQSCSLKALRELCNEIPEELSQAESKEMKLFYSNYHHKCEISGNEGNIAIQTTGSIVHILGIVILSSIGIAGLSDDLPQLNTFDINRPPFIICLIFAGIWLLGSIYIIIVLATGHESYQRNNKFSSILYFGQESVTKVVMFLSVILVGGVLSPQRIPRSVAPELFPTMTILCMVLFRSMASTYYAPYAYFHSTNYPSEFKKMIDMYVFFWKNP
jgi:hypothetical protein